MKTKEYVKKYELNINSKFDHTEFISDLTFDFITLLEVGKSKENIKGFDNTVRAIRMKWDAINNKTIGQLPDKLWSYFWATVIVKMKEQLFPEVIKRQNEERAEKKRQHEEYKKWKKQEFGSGFSDYNAFFQMMMAKMMSKLKPTSSFEKLELSDTATIEEVQSSYRKLSMKHHPDKGGKQDKFIEITEAKNKCLAYLNK